MKPMKLWKAIEMLGKAGYDIKDVYIDQHRYLSFGCIPTSMKTADVLIMFQNIKGQKATWNIFLNP